MDTKKIAEISKRLDAALAELATRIEEYGLCTLSGHQKGITISIEGMPRAFRVAAVGGREVSYSSVVQPHMELALLGIKRACAVRVEEQRWAIRKIEDEMRAAVAGVAA